MTRLGGSEPDRAAWRLVALLWFCGFFNYADRQAIFSVFPALQAEFGLDDQAKGMIGSAFMVVYAGMSPFAGAVVDRFSRRWLVAGGLAVWSLICVLTGTAQGFFGLLFYRAAEGLGESFYFPASMSLISAYHGPGTRSRAMSLHQTSVYAGTALGGLLAGWLGQHAGWRAPFWVLGLTGLVYAAWLPGRLAEPKPAGVAGSDHHASWRAGLVAMVRTPSAVALMAAFAAANFVAMALLSWMPDHVHRRFGLNLTGSAAVASLFLPTANLVGALVGGRLADALARRYAGGRMWVQAGGLVLGAPCVFVVGRTDWLPLAAAALVGIGLGKGLYDANIFASLYDRVAPSVRGAAAGVMNTVGWLGASLAPWVIGSASERVGLGQAMGATAWVYLVGAGLAGLAAVLAACEARVRRS
ncbi:MAG: MFS transporter [Isosphaeraceae bacterium]|jgi:MFS family permease|nr:MAG: MFS transporter [Isosphaeraceae bacterium]